MATDGVSTSRACAKCLVSKPVSEFYLKKNGSPHVWCFGCAAEYARERRKAKGGLIRAQSRERRKDPSRNAKANALCRKWYRDNREYSREQNRAWREANREAHLAQMRKHYRENAEEHKAQVAAWQKANPEKVRQHSRAKNHTRRALNLNAEGKHTAADIARIFKAQRGKCAACREKLIE